MNLIEEHTQLSLLLANPDVSDSLKHELRKELAELEARKPGVSLSSVSVYPRYEVPLNVSITQPPFAEYAAIIYDKEGRRVMSLFTTDADKEKFERHLELLVLLLESGIGIEEERGIYQA